MTELPNNGDLLSENAELRRRLEDAEKTLLAITSGEVDALVVNTRLGERVFTLEGADTVYRIAIETINEGVITLSTEGTILYSNHFFARMMKIDLNRIIGTSIFDFAKQKSHDSLATLLGQDSGRAEISLQISEGIEIPAYIATRRIQLDKPDDLRNTD